MNYLFYFFLLSCILLTALFFFLEFIPRMISLYQHRFKKNKIQKNHFSDIEKMIFNASLSMAKSDKVTMVWEDPNHSFIEKLITLFRKKNSYSDEFKKYNYPRAFLLLGIISYLIKKNEKKALYDFQILFDKYITPEGKPSFKLNRVDQTPFGEVALKLYIIYKEKKYIRFADQIYSYLVRNIDPADGTINYRPEIKVILNDTIGMTIPFLLQYAKITKNQDAIKIAEQQIDYFLKYGVDNFTHLPVHGINKKTRTKIGSANWGRGIGWYYLGLSNCAKNNLHYMSYVKNLDKSLHQLKNKQELWSQFPGSSEKFDASSTLMIIYSTMSNNPTYLTKNEFLNLILLYLSEKGAILQTSGDTISLNEYSKTFGLSELSQGFLLLLLTKLKDRD